MTPAARRIAVAALVGVGLTFPATAGVDAAAPAPADRVLADISAEISTGAAAGDLAETAAAPVEVSIVGRYLAARHAQAVRDYPAAALFLGEALAQAPDQPSLRRDTHVAMLLDGRFGEAETVAAALVAAGDAVPLARLTLAVAAIRDGRLDEADGHLREIEPNSVFRLIRPMLRAWTLAEAGRFAEALDALQDLSANGQTLPLSYVHAGLLSAAAGDAIAAERSFRMAIADEGDPTLRTVDLFGQFLERQGRGDEAIELYQTFLSEGTRSAILDASIARAERDEVPPPAIASASAGAAEALFSIAGAVSRQPVPETALLIARHALVLQPRFPLLQALTGQLLESLERIDEANTVFAGVDPASPLSWQLRLRIATNLDELDRSDEAVAMLRAMAAERASDYDALVDLGDLLRRHERYGEAVEVYDAAVARIPELKHHHWSLLYARGIALERSKLWDRAEADFLKVLEFEPDQPLVLNYLGYSWIDMGRNLEQALDMVRRAVEQRPNDGYIVDSLGWAYYKLGRYADAVRELERAVEVRPEDPVINDHLGDAYWQVGREREARFQWTAALGLDPEPDVRTAIEAKLANGLIREARAAKPGAAGKAEGN